MRSALVFPPLLRHVPRRFSRRGATRRVSPALRRRPVPLAAGASATLAASFPRGRGGRRGKQPFQSAGDTRQDGLLGLRLRLLGHSWRGRHFRFGGLRVALRRRGWRNGHRRLLRRGRGAARAGFRHFRLVRRLGELVAGHGALGGRGVVADALDIVMGRFQIRRRHDHHMGGGALFDVRHLAPLLVQQIGADVDGHAGAHDGTALFQALLFHHAQNRQRERLHVADARLAGTTRTNLRGEFGKRRAQALPRHLHQAEARNAAHLHARPVRLQRLAHLVLHGALVARCHHVDEVDDDQASHVAQPQLARHLLGGLQIGDQRCFFNVRALRGAGGVDVDGHQRLGGVDHHAAAGGQFHFALKGRLDLALDLIAAEERRRVLVELDAILVVRHHRVDELVRLLERLLAVDEHLADVAPQAIPNGAHDDVVFLVQKGGRLDVFRGLGDGAVQLQQVVQIPLQILGFAPDAGGAHDHAHARRHFQVRQRLAQRVSVLALDAARDAAGARVVRHQHQVARGEAEKGGEGRAFVAALLFLHLDDERLPFAEHVLDLETALLLPFSGGARGASLRRLLGIQGLGDLLERQKSVPLGAELDEGGFQTRFDPRYAGLVDVAFLLLVAAVLNVQIVELLPIHQSDPHFLRLGRVD